MIRKTCQDTIQMSSDEIFMILWGSKLFSHANECAGTFGYIPPEYGQFWRSTTRGDVYSFGVILLELLTGREPTGNTEVEGGNLVDLVRSTVRSNGDPSELLDSSVIASSAQYNNNNNIKTAMFQALHIAIMCTCDDPTKRPSMMEVIKLLRNLEDNYKLVAPTLPLSDDELPLAKQVKADDDGGAESLLVFDCNSKSVILTNPPESPGRMWSLDLLCSFKLHLDRSFNHVYMRSS